jgi:hypothetical protein
VQLETDDTIKLEVGLRANPWHDTDVVDPFVAALWTAMRSMVPAPIAVQLGLWELTDQLDSDSLDDPVIRYLPSAPLDGPPPADRSPLEGRGRDDLPT